MTMAELSTSDQPSPTLSIHGSDIAGAVVFSVLAPEIPDVSLQVGSRFPEATKWAVEHAHEINEVKDAAQEVLRHFLGG
jgi:hypothetical protein